MAGSIDPRLIDRFAAVLGLLADEIETSMRDGSSTRYVPLAIWSRLSRRAGCALAARHDWRRRFVGHPRLEHRDTGDWRSDRPAGIDRTSRGHAVLCLGLVFVGFVDRHLAKGSGTAVANRHRGRRGGNHARRLGPLCSAHRGGIFGRNVRARLVNGRSTGGRGRCRSAVATLGSQPGLTGLASAFDDAGFRCRDAMLG